MRRGGRERDLGKKVFCSFLGRGFCSVIRYCIY